MIARASRLGKSIAFLMIDLDGFKKVNDTYGHDSGDIVLREAADRMREVVPQSSVIARLGGDEFVICLMFEPEFLTRSTRSPNILSKPLHGQLPSPMRHKW